MAENTVPMSEFGTVYCSSPTKGNVGYFIADDLITFAGLRNLRASLHVSPAGGLSSSASAAGCWTEKGCHSLRAWIQPRLKKNRENVGVSRSFKKCTHKMAKWSLL